MQFDISIRIAVQARDSKQAHLLNRSIATAVREFDGDNQLINRITGTKKDILSHERTSKGN